MSFPSPLLFLYHACAPVVTSFWYDKTIALVLTSFDYYTVFHGMPASYPPFNITHGPSRVMVQYMNSRDQNKERLKIAKHINTTKLSSKQKTSGESNDTPMQITGKERVCLHLLRMLYNTPKGHRHLLTSDCSSSHATDPILCHKTCGD